MTITLGPYPRAATTLGTATVENRATLMRRVMQVVCMPFRDEDAVRETDAITVVDSGTGQPERCQVESWAMRYPSGNERVVRLTYPAVLPANTLRITHEFEKSSGGALPAFSLPATVVSALGQMSVYFFCGPKATHATPVMVPGQTPQVVFSGPRSIVLRYFARVYEPAQAPTLRTQMWAELDLELLHDEDYAKVWTRWGVCDPRVNDDIYDRSAFSDVDTEVGFWFTGANSATARPVPMYQMQTVNAQYGQSLAWNGALWQWVQDRRVQLGSVTLGPVLPWGCMYSAAAVLLFGQGSTGTQLREDSLAAWVQRPIPSHAIADTWEQNEEAYGPVGVMPMRPKAHTHWQRRDAAFVRTQLENESEAVVNRTRPGYAWDNYYGDSILSFPSPHPVPDGTGSAHSWFQNPLWIAAAYRVPGLASVLERIQHVNPQPWFYREQDGRVVTAIDHPNMVIVRGTPGEINSTTLGDMLGKNLNWNTTPRGLQRWRATPSQPGRLTTPTGQNVDGNDTAHFDHPWNCATSVIYGDRGIRRIAEHVGYTTVLGDWQALPQNRASTDQARGLGRGLTMHAWHMWAFGNDARWADRCADTILSHSMLPALAQTRARWPNALYRELNIYPAGGNRTDFVELWNNDYVRSWEVPHGMIGYIGIARLGSHLRPELAVLAQIGREVVEDILTLCVPRVIDHATGVVSWQWQPPDNRGVMTFALAAALSPDTNPANRGSRRLTAAEWADNNHSLCFQQTMNCSLANAGFARFHERGFGSPGAFVNSVVQWSLGGRDTASAIPLRYIPDGTDGNGNGAQAEDNMSTLIFNEQGSAPYYVSFSKWSRWGIGRMDTPYVGAVTQRGAHGLNGINAMTHSRIHADSVYLATWTTSENIVRHNRITGAAIATITPAQTPTVAWSGLCAVSRFGQDVLALLDARDPSYARTAYRILLTTEQAPTTTLSTWTFTFADGVKRDTRGIAWDSHANVWIVTASGAGEGTSLWAIADGGAIAARVPVQSIILESPAGSSPASTISIDAENLLLVVAYDDGRRHIYRWTGCTPTTAGVWGVPRNRTVGDSIVCFSPHARTDDAQRFVTVTNGGPFWEHPV